MAKLIGGILLLASVGGIVSWACGVSPAKSVAIAAVVAVGAIVALVVVLLLNGDR